MYDTYYSAETLDDLMHQVISVLEKLPFNIKATRGNTSEMIGVMLHLKNPRARLSRTETKGKPFSAIGELIWYLTGSNELSLIYHYIKRYEKETEDGQTVYGGYGPRLLKSQGTYNQIENVIKLLKSKSTTRKAVIQIFEAKDIADDHKEIPCTCTMQFLLRDGRLHMITYMRSNDAYYGLPHDIFSFTMLQELIAREVGVELGEYKHSVGSLHLYDTILSDVRSYLEEGFQGTLSNLAMPPMPIGSPWPAIKKIIKAERIIRGGYELKIDEEYSKLEDYWLDIIRLLQVFSFSKSKRVGLLDRLIKIKNEMSSNVYNTYLYRKIDALAKD